MSEKETKKERERVTFIDTYQIARQIDRVLEIDRQIDRYSKCRIQIVRDRWIDPLQEIGRLFEIDCDRKIERLREFVIDRSIDRNSDRKIVQKERECV